MRKRPFKILSLNISEKKGIQKKPIDQMELKPDYGIIGDAHAADWHRQISLLAEEDINTIRGKGIEIKFGDFAENITTDGVDLSSLPIGSRLYMGETELEVTQIGKECHQHCAIYHTVGDCVMPRKGIFAKVIRGGYITIESECHYIKIPERK
jgi:MOSC domain-containing protein YiiM